MKKKICILSAFFLIYYSAFSQQQLYYFSGSDWCAPCINFKSNFIESKDFIKLIDSLNINFEILDFPQKKKGLSKKYLKKCDSLANIYNKNGSFPKLVSITENSIITHDHNISNAKLINNLRRTFHFKSLFFEEKKLIMGSVFKLKIECDSLNADRIFNASWRFLNEIENSISSWDSSSITSLVNKNAGIKSVTVPIEYFKLVSFCKKISESTQGAFDITVKSALLIWDWKKEEIPKDSIIELVKNNIGSRFIELNESDTSIYLTKRGVSIDFGAIGKGYAADKLIEFWKKKFSLKNGVVDAGGDLVKLNSEKGVFVFVPNPMSPKDTKFKIEVYSNSIVTSGDYYRNFEVNGERYSHIIDPKTCRPTKSEITSVTVIAPNGTIGDALATAITVLGRDTGLNLVNQLPGVEAIMILSSGDAFYSKGVIHYND